MTLRLLIALALIATACGGQTQQSVPAAAPVPLKHFPLDSMDEVRAASGVSLDTAVSSDQKGSLRVDATGPTVVALFEVTDVSIEDAVLVYQAAVQSEGLEGQAFLEMWVRIPGKGEFFSRGLDHPLSGTMSWMTVSTPFFLEAGQKPDLIRLNLSINGKGKVWIDDISLLRQPLPSR